jgi:hypothetical protein
MTERRSEERENMHRLKSLIYPLALALAPLSTSPSAARPTDLTALTLTPINAQDVPAEAIALTQARPELTARQGGGRVVVATRWTDAQGESLWLLTERRGDGPKERSLRLIAYRLTRPSPSAQWQVAWRAQEWIERCAFDLVGGYFVEDLHITDLNANGIAEVTFGYEFECVSGVDPYRMKVLAYEGVRKYALRGARAPKMFAELASPPREQTQGAPAALRELMRGVWERHRLYGE